MVTSLPSVHGHALCKEGKGTEGHSLPFPLSLPSHCVNAIQVCLPVSTGLCQHKQWQRATGAAIPLMSRGTIRDQFGPENKWKWTKWRHDKSKERIYRNGTCMTSPKYCRTMVGSPLSPQCVVPQGCRGQCHQGEACASALSIGCQDNEAISSTRQEEDLVTTSGQGRGNATGNAKMSGMTEEMKGNVFPAETSKFGRCLPPVILLFSWDLLVLELKIKTYRLIDTLWLLSMRPRHEVIKNNSSCHYPNNSVGLSDCNPV